MYVFARRKNTNCRGKETSNSALKRGRIRVEDAPGWHTTPRFCLPSSHPTCLLFIFPNYFGKNIRKSAPLTTQMCDTPSSLVYTRTSFILLFFLTVSTMIRGKNAYVNNFCSSVRGLMFFRKFIPNLEMKKVWANENLFEYEI